jgi:ribulose-phosphate 3-epimerase
MSENVKPYLLSASILSADFSHLEDQIRQVESAGIDWIHIDVMDGSFVPNLTMGPFIVEACRQITGLPLDVHLMIDHPERMIQAFAQAGANHLSVHVENNPNLYRLLQSIRELGCRPGVVINPGTPVSSITSVLHLVDIVLVMTVNPGYSGQAYLPEVLPKVVQIRHSLDEIQSDALIQVDGGITPLTLAQTAQAGARVFVSATSIFKHPAGIHEGVRLLRAAQPSD